MQPVFEFLIKYAPLFAMLGLWHLLAKLLDSGWEKAKIFAGHTPTKIDDFLVHLMDPLVREVKDLIDRGDVDGAQKKLDALRAVAQGAKK